MKTKAVEGLYLAEKPTIAAFREIAKEVQMKVGNTETLEALTYTLDEAVNHVGYGKFQLKLMFLAGLGWAADAFEVIILSLIGQYVSCEWDITMWENALLTSVVFGGMMFGSPVFGKLADRFGRKTSLAGSLVFLFLFGSVSAASPAYGWMAAFRALMGFALGGVAQGLTLCSEYFPTNLRGRAGFYLCYFWSFGTIGVILMAWVIMINLDSWRVLLAVASIPAFLGILSIKFYPESARFYLVSNNYEKAQKVVKDMAAMNGKDLPPGELKPMAECTNRGVITDLLGRKYRKSTLLFWYMWLASAFCYYGIALISPIIIQRGSVVNMGNDTDMGFSSNFSSLVACVPLTNENYIDLLWTSSAELPGILIFSFLVECCNRKVLMSASCIGSGVLVFLLLLPVMKTVILLFLFAARALILAIFQLTLVMTAEAFPTTLRAVAMGTGGSFCRLGGLVVPYVAQVLFVSNPVVALCVLGIAVSLAGVAALFLPLETRGRELEESHVTPEPSN